MSSHSTEECHPGKTEGEINILHSKGVLKSINLLFEVYYMYMYKTPCKKQQKKRRCLGIIL